MGGTWRRDQRDSDEGWIRPAWCRILNVMYLAPGVKLLAEEPGEGPAAAKGDEVTIECQVALSRGEVVSERHSSTALLAKRRLIAGIEKALLGMKEGGYRQVRISPHLAYGSTGLPGLVPPDAVLVVDLWLCRIEKSPS